MSHVGCVTKPKGCIKGKHCFFFFTELVPILIWGNKLIKEIPLILFYISIAYRIEFIDQLKGREEAKTSGVFHTIFYANCTSC